MADYAACAVGGGTGDGGFFTTGQQDDYPTVVAYNYSADLGADTDAPTIENVTPASGSAITSTGTVQFDLLDNGTFYTTPVYVYFPANGEYEVAYWSGGFTPRYQRGSSRSVIAGGYRFVLSRWEGWPSAPRIISDSRDSGGNTTS